VADDTEKVVREGERLGLVLNTSKCELITHRGFDVQSNILRSFRRVDMEEAILLGAPMFAGPALDDTWSDRCDDLTRAVDRLTKIGSQEALILLRASFSAPKVLHLIRCSPSKDHPALALFDSQLKSAICQITNSNLRGHSMASGFSACEGRGRPGLPRSHFKLFLLLSRPQT